MKDEMRIKEALELVYKVLGRRTVRLNQLGGSREMPEAYATATHAFAYVAEILFGTLEQKSISIDFITTWLESMGHSEASKAADCYYDDSEGSASVPAEEVSQMLYDQGYEAASQIMDVFFKLY